MYSRLDLILKKTIFTYLDYYEDEVMDDYPSKYKFVQFFRQKY